jgi:predicted nucleotide-binding protein
LQIADRLNDMSQSANTAEIKEPLERLEKAAKKIGKAWSGSFLESYASIHYDNLDPPPIGCHFAPNVEMKEDSWLIRPITEKWLEYSPGEIEAEIWKLADNPDFTPARKLASHAERLFKDCKADILDILSVLTTSFEQDDNCFIDSLRGKVEKIVLFTQEELLKKLIPDRKRMPYGSFNSAYSSTPPHLTVLAEVIALKQIPKSCDNLSQLSRRAASYISRMQMKTTLPPTIGTNVFIGHGRSLIWRELKDFINERLDLPWDEFERDPVAGIANIARLAEMLDNAAIAFLIMSGEDEQSNGKLHARMNVIHETGLFQGRLGFTKAIILLEDGCEGFSNIEGLGQIRFPKGSIKAVFEEIRRILEREGIIDVN